MKMLRRAAPIAVAVLLGACGDSTGPGGVTIDDLVGTWSVTQWKYTATGSSASVDLATLAGTSASMTVGASGAYTISGTLASVAISLSGTYAVNGSTLSILESGATAAQNAPFTLSGNTWTISGLEGDWDFDDDGSDDPATLVIVFTRT